MATKYYCDKCDAELSEKASRAVRISVQIVDDKTISHEIDLCERCRNGVLKSVDPKEWANAPRVAREYAK